MLTADRWMQALLTVVVGAALFGAAAVYLLLPAPSGSVPPDPTAGGPIATITPLPGPAAVGRPMPLGPPAPLGGDPAPPPAPPEPGPLPPEPVIAEPPFPAPGPPVPPPIPAPNKPPNPDPGIPSVPQPQREPRPNPPGPLSGDQAPAVPPDDPVARP
jgi:hypothetical protein